MRPARLVLSALALLIGPAALAGVAARPNILWITVEDMSPRLASYGDGTVSTPRLDRLAAEGVRYTRDRADPAALTSGRHPAHDRGSGDRVRGGGGRRAPRPHPL
jgi:hypothetical protein